MEQNLYWRSVLMGLDPLYLLEVALERYQAEVFGNQLMNAADVVSILEILNESGNKDALVRKKDGFVNIIEQTVKKHKQKVIDLTALREKALLPGSEEQEHSMGEEPPLREWQEEIMEENDARSGFLFGEIG